MRTGIQAANQMEKWHKEGRTGVKGLCLKTCREAYLLPAKYPSAIISWNRTPNKYKNKDFRKAKIGAVHYYSGGKYGHIVIQSEFKNKVWGTDLPISDKVGLHHRRLPVNRWKYKYLGWSNWLNGKELKLTALPK
jgi:hypothetical protein